MPGCHGLLHAISEEPWDDLPRLVLADWLDEHGDEAARARAEFIRVGCRYEGLPDEHPDEFPLLRKERQLFTAHRDAWLAGLPDELLWRQDAFDRGMLERLVVGPWRIGTAGFSAAWDALDVRQVNIVGDLVPHSWEVQDVLQNVRRLVTLPVLRRLTTLVLCCTHLTDEGLRLVADCPYLDGLLHLNLRGNYITTRGADALAASPWLSRLEWLDIAENRIADATVEHLRQRWPIVLFEWPED
jgi:uncharacterized protein (TIGR02996 family)